MWWRQYLNTNIVISNLVLFDDKMLSLSNSESIQCNLPNIDWANTTIHKPSYVHWEKKVLVEAHNSNKTCFWWVVLQLQLICTANLIQESRRKKVLRKEKSLKRKRYFSRSLKDKTCFDNQKRGREQRKHSVEGYGKKDLVLWKM